MQDLFSPTDWASATKKRVVIPAGVEIGGNNLDWALVPAWDATGQAGSWNGDLILENRGVISGVPGGGNSGRGGNCIRAIFGGRSGQKLQLINSGTIRAGGGGGGRGGDGGGGFWDEAYTAREPASGEYYDYPNTYWSKSEGMVGFKSWVTWGGTQVFSVGDSNIGSYTAADGRTYYRGAQVIKDGYFTRYYVYRTYPASQRHYTSGGAGGNGGNGVGYGAGAGAGAWGAGGGANAGAGGRGGDGGGWGANGAAGAAGGNGNNGGGAPGAGGGPAGYSITGLGYVQVVQNTGVIVGQQA
ncbi:hypothetical protein [Brucella intermedia]|uniref:hypothetical protein n=1 Tax=Brucella intermedia TaxID=94625 RepID=UPI00235F2CC4|nr:hypothetical protein [Brucella intermedia]